MQPPGLQDAIDNAARLRAVVSKLPPQAAESIARKYVARNVADIGAWEILIACVGRNGSSAEKVRLAEQLVHDHPDAPQARLIAATVFCDEALLDKAWQLLANLTAADLETAVRIGQLLLLRDPDAARDAFSRVLRHDPGNLEANLGVQNAAALSKAGKPPQTVFFLCYDWHRSIQRSVFEACIASGIPAVMTASYWLARALAPRVLVLSDIPNDRAQFLRSDFPGARIVHTRHGFSDKNYAYFAAGAVDFVCVSSQQVADEYVNNGMFDRGRFWVTGYPQLDPLFARLKTGPKRKAGRTVLFAPTFTRGLSSGIELGPAAVKAIRGDDHGIRVVIRPHPHMRRFNAAILNDWKLRTLHMPNVVYNDDPDAEIADLILETDVLVSDISSFALSYLAVDRPLVCLDIQADEASSPRYASDGVEWRMREAADVVTQAGLAEAVRAALENPGRKSSERRALARYLFDDLRDGKAGRRIANKIASHGRDA